MNGIRPPTMFIKHWPPPDRNTRLILYFGVCRSDPIWVLYFNSALCGYIARYIGCSRKYVNMTSLATRHAGCHTLDVLLSWLLRSVIIEFEWAQMEYNWTTERFDQLLIHHTSFASKFAQKRWPNYKIRHSKMPGTGLTSRLPGVYSSRNDLAVQ